MSSDEETGKYGSEADSVSSEVCDLEAMLAQQELELTTLREEAARNALLVETAKGIVHDFNNHLMGVEGNMDLAERADGTEEAAEYFQHARGSLARLKEGTKSLLQLGQAQVCEYSPENMDLSSVINEVLIAAPHIRSAVNLKLNVAEGIYQIYADSNMMYRSFFNLLANAFDAINAVDGRGTITVSAMNYHISDGDRKGDYVLLKVADTGCGMDEDTLAKCRGIYFTTKGDKGTGIGLSCVDSVMKTHGGFLEIESEPGKGTEFSCYIPRAEYKRAGCVCEADDLPAGISAKPLFTVTKPGEAIGAGNRID